MREVVLEVRVRTPTDSGQTVLANVAEYVGIKYGLSTVKIVSMVVIQDKLNENK